MLQAPRLYSSIRKPRLILDLREHRYCRLSGSVLDCSGTLAVRRKCVTDITFPCYHGSALRNRTLGGYRDRYGDQCKDQDALIAFYNSSNYRCSVKDLIG